jgi:Zn-dependent protease
VRVFAGVVLAGSELMAFQPFRIGTMFGIPIFVHPSWLIALVLATLSLGSELAKVAGAFAPVVALVTALVFFASILAHELGHGVVAMRRGTQVRSITLFIFGGIAELGKEPERAIDELFIAAAGPLVSLLIAGGALAAAKAGVLSPVLAEPIAWLGRVNLGVAIFNCLPGFPLDGGRVARALLWMRSGDMMRATKTTAGMGRWIGYAIIVFAVLTALSVNVVSGVWIAFVGWFLVQAANAALIGVGLRSALQGLSVSRVICREPPVVDTMMSVATYVESVVQSGRRAHLVMYHGEPYAYVTLEETATVPRDAWPFTAIWRIAHPIETLPAFPPAVPLEEALETLSRAPFGVVREDGRILGFVEREAMLAFVEARIAASRGGGAQIHRGTSAAQSS